MAVLAIYSCDKESMPGQATPGQAFELELGESAFFNKGDFKIFFSQMLGDNRCPTSIECMRAGEAKVKVLVQKSGKVVTSFELGTKPVESIANAVAFEDFNIQLKDVRPYPTSNKPIPTEEYAIQLQID